MKTYPEITTLPSPEELLRQLVSIPSLNPGEKSDFSTPYGESRMVKFLAEFLEPWADSIDTVEVYPDRPNLIARFDGRDNQRSFAFEAHSDTVGISGMEIDPFTANRSEHRLSGRGACDDKGPMVAMLYGLLHYLARHGQPPCTWYFISTCDEELGGGGARHLVESGFRCDGIIVGEPTGHVPLNEHKGALRLEMKINGKAGHSAYPEMGANAIHAAADFILRLEDRIHKAGYENSGELGSITLNVGTIEGGDQVNRIPDATQLEIDLRLPAGFTENLALAEVLQTAKEVEFHRTRITFQHRITQSYPPFKMKTTSVFDKILKPIYERSNGETMKARYATNAGFFASAGIPCIICGPGHIEQAHTSTEWIDLREVEIGIQLFMEVIRQSNSEPGEDRIKSHR